MSFIISAALSAILEMDHVGTRVEGDRTIYTFKTTSLIPSLVEMKSKVFSLFDLPMDIPEDITVREVKKGPIFKEYLVDIAVPTRKIGKVSNLLAKKYGIIRKRAYR